MGSKIEVTDSVMENLIKELLPEAESKDIMARIRKVIQILGIRIQMLCSNKIDASFDTQKILTIRSIDEDIANVLFSCKNTCADLNDIAKEYHHAYNAKMNRTFLQICLDSCGAKEDNQLEQIDDFFESFTKSSCTLQKFIREPQPLMDIYNDTFTLIKLQVPITINNITHETLNPVRSVGNAYELSFKETEFEVQQIYPVFVVDNMEDPTSLLVKYEYKDSYDQYVDYTINLEANKRGTIHKIEIKPEEEAQHKVIDKLLKNSLPSSQINGMFYELDNYSLNGNSIFSIKPSNQYILKNYFGMTGRSIIEVVNSFIIVRIIEQEITEGTNKFEKKFVEMVYCNLAKLQGKNEVREPMNLTRKYNIRIFYLSKKCDGTDEVVIKSVVEEQNSIEKQFQTIYKEMVENKICENFLDMKDRGICIKLKLHENRELNSEKEYLTYLRTQQRVANFATIVEHDCKYIRYKSNIEELDDLGETKDAEKPKKGDKKKNKKAAPAKKTDKGKNSKSKDKNALTPEQAALLTKLDSAERNYLIKSYRIGNHPVFKVCRKKEVTYEGKKNNIKVVEKITEPNVIEIFKYLKKASPKLKSFAYEMGESCELRSLDFITMGTFETHPVRYHVKTKVHTPQYDNDLQSVPEYKPEGPDKANICKIDDIYKMGENDLSILHKKKTAFDLARFYFKNSTEEKIILKNIFISKTLGILHEYELKNGILTHEQIVAKTRVPDDIFLQNLASKFMIEDFPEYEYNLRKTNNVDTEMTDLTRVTTHKIFVSNSTAKLICRVTEPNPIAIMIGQCPEAEREKIFPNELKRFYDPKGISENIKFEGDPSRVICKMESFTGYQKHDEFCPYRKYGTFMIVAKSEIIFVDEDSKETTIQKSYEPKIVRFFCDDCCMYGERLNFVDEFISTVHFTKRYEIINFLDLICCLKSLAIESDSSSNGGHTRLIIEKYKEHIQRIINAVKFY